MTRMFAEMTAWEREECVGMFASIEDAELAVIVEAGEGDTCVVIYPELLGVTASHLNEMVNPRFDLPRAWTPDGEPVDGSWEKSTAELPTKNYKGTYTQHYRRWAGEWEQTEEPERANGMVNPYV